LWKAKQKLTPPGYWAEVGAREAAFRMKSGDAPFLFPNALFLPLDLPFPKLLPIPPANLPLT
jgi:hypothetical protein